MSSVQFSGLASGIDSGALIDSVVEARQVRNDLRKKEISDIQSESETLQEFKTKITELNDLLDKFRTANGGGISKKASSSDTSVLTATSSASAQNGIYNLTVTSVANTATGSFDNSYTGTDDTVSGDGGDITVTVGTGANETTIVQSVTAGGTTLEDFVTEFNNNPDASGKVTASAVNIGTEDSPDYRLMFNTVETGVDKGSLAVSSTAADMPASTISQATNAEFSIDGIGTSITRSSNTVSDIINGVTFSIQDTGNSKITVSNDSDKTFSEVQEFVDVYNDLVGFLAENNTVERVESGNRVENIFASLAKSRVDEDFMAGFRNNLAAATSSSGTEVQSLAQMGIVTNRDGTISLREDDFKSAVQNDLLGSTQTLNNFADRAAGVGGTIYEYTKFNGQIDIALQSNNSQIDNISNSIAALDRQTDSLRRSLTLRFAKLESTVGRLQNQQQALTSVLSGLQ